MIFQHENHLHIWRVCLEEVYRFWRAAPKRMGSLAMCVCEVHVCVKGCEVCVCVKVCVRHACVGECMCVWGGACVCVCVCEGACT